MKSAMIQVGGDTIFSPESMGKVIELISTILRVGRETGMDQKTIRHAIDVGMRAVGIPQLTISNNRFVSNPSPTLKQPDNDTVTVHHDDDY